MVRVSKESNENPFMKVKTMIEELINKLQDEHSQEARRSAYCLEEISSNEKKLSSLDITLGKLSSFADVKRTENEELKLKIAKLTSDIAEIISNIGEETNLRQTRAARFHTEIKALSEGKRSAQAA